MKDPREFPVRPIEDWVIIEKIEVKTIPQKKAERGNITIVPGKAPMNIMDLEKQAASEAAKYENAEEQLLALWDEHPMQGIVKAIGPGRSIEEGVIIPMPVKTGDHVYLRGKTGEPIVVNKKLYWMHKSHEIFAVEKKT
ncbi:MAG: co-chaperone GroES family protein [Candidatus Hodarchaeales archaeon]|jgi:co-chaperonin GroES (HSP10)